MRYTLLALVIGAAAPAQAQGGLLQYPPEYAGTLLTFLKGEPTKDIDTTRDLDLAARHLRTT